MGPRSGLDNAYFEAVHIHLLSVQLEFYPEKGAAHGGIYVFHEAY